MFHSSLAPPGAKGPYFASRRVNSFWNVFSQSVADCASLNDRWIIVNLCSGLKFSMTVVRGLYSLVMGRDIRNGVVAGLGAGGAPGGLLAGSRQGTSGTACASSGVMPNLRGPQPFNGGAAVAASGAASAAS